MADASPLVLDGLRGVALVAPVADVAPTVPVQRLSGEEIEANLAEWERDFVTAKAPATIRAIRADWGVYLQWCEGVGVAPLPLSLENLLAFVDNALARGRRETTLRRYLYTIGKVHEKAGLANPGKDPLFSRKLEVRLADLPKDRREPRQTGGLTRDDLDRVLALLTPDRPLHLRDAALLCLAADTMCRESELVMATREAFKVDDDGQITYDVRWSTINKTVKHDYRYVSPETWDRIKVWCAQRGITTGPIFLPIAGRKKRPLALTADERESIVKCERQKVAHAALLPQEVARIFRRYMDLAKVEKRVTGHSFRLGQAKELFRDGATHDEIANSGNWGSTRSVRRYTVQSGAGSGAMARMVENRRAKKPNGTPR